MKYVSATLMYLSIGICLGAGFGNSINEIDSTILLWIVLILGSLITSLIIFLLGKALFPDMKFRFLHSFLCIGSALVLSYFFIITKRELSLLMVFITIPIAVFFTIFLILSKFFDMDKTPVGEMTMGQFKNIKESKKSKSNPATMLTGVSEIRDYVEKKK
jgi:hypothetical protein